MPPQSESISHNGRIVETPKSLEIDKEEQDTKEPLSKNSQCILID